MNCKKCNAPLVNGDQFCKNCGAAVNEVNAQPMGQPVQPMGAPAQPMGQPVKPMAGGPVGGGFAQPMQPQQPVNAQPKKNTTLFIIIGIVVVALIAAGVILYLNLGKKDNNASTNNSSNGGSVTTTDNKENNGSSSGTTGTNGTSGNSGQSGTTTVGNSSSYTVKVNGFTLEVPTNLIYEVSGDDSVILYDEDETWAAYINVLQGTYSSVIDKKAYFQSYYQSLGYTVNAVEEKTISGSQYFIMELSKDGENVLLGVTKANSMYIFVVSLFTIDNEFDYTTLGSLNSILTNAKYGSDSSSISNFNRVNLGGIVSGLAQ